jgi:hypothetical protein
MPLTKNVCKECQLPHASSEELREGLCIECLVKLKNAFRANYCEAIRELGQLQRKKRARKKA